MIHNRFLAFCTILLSFTSHALRAQDREVEAYLDSASQYRLTGDTMEVYYLTKAIQLSPFDAGLYELRAYAKTYVNIPDNPKYGPRGAIRDLDLAIKLNPKNSVLYEQRGYQKFVLGNSIQAIKDLDKSIRIDRKRPAAYRKRGDAQWDMKNYSAALYDFLEAASLDTTSIYNLRKGADCLYELGNYYDAIRYYNSAIKKGKSRSSVLTNYNEDFVLSYLYRANSFGNVGRDKEAIKDYTEVINYNEGFSGPAEYTIEAYKFRGMARLNLEEKKEACEDFKKAELLGDKESTEYIKTYCK